MKTKIIKEFSIHDKKGIIVEIDSNEDMILGLYRIGSKTQEFIDIDSDITIYGVFVDKTDFTFVKKTFNTQENHIKSILSDYDFGVFYLNSDDQDDKEKAIRHETSHALFKHDKFYRKISFNAFKNLSSEIQERIKSRLNDRGYVFETEEQMINEATAWIVENSSRMITNNRDLKNIYKIINKFVN